MKRSLAVVFFCAFLAAIVSCGPGERAAVEPNPIERVENGLFSGAPVSGVAGASLEERMAELDVPAVSIAVIQDFEIVWANAYGVADPATGRLADTDTLFQAASISKPVTATAVHRLVESGTLDLDVPVNTYLESWRLPENELTSATPVTLRMLLSHTGGTTVSGFPGYEPTDALPTLQQVLDGSGLILPQVAAGNEPVWHLYVVRSPKRHDLMQTLAEAEIGSQIHYPIPPHMQEAYSDLGHTHDEFPLARQLADEVFSLPMGPNAPEGTANAVGRVLGCLATADARG